MKSFARQAFAILAIVGVALTACNYGTSSFPKGPSVPVSKFSYVGLTGPLNWYGLNETANFLFDKGMNQSPIDITPSAITLDNGVSCILNVPSYPSGAVFENLGTNVEVVVNGTLVDSGKTYNLAQFHFHAPPLVSIASMKRSIRWNYTLYLKLSVSRLRFSPGTAIYALNN
jgi:carbonic anhydrase